MIHRLLFLLLLACPQSRKELIHMNKSGKHDSDLFDYSWLTQVRISILYVVSILDKCLYEIYIWMSHDKMEKIKLM